MTMERPLTEIRPPVLKFCESADALLPSQIDWMSVGAASAYPSSAPCTVKGTTAARATANSPVKAMERSIIMRVVMRGQVIE